MDFKRINEYIFFFGLLILVGYVAWLMLFPFLAALVLSSIMVVLCYPMYEFIQRFTPAKNRSIAAILSTIIVLFAVIIPVLLLSTLLVNEFVAFYTSLDGSELVLDQMFDRFESSVQLYVPGFEFNFTEQVQESGAWLTRNIGAIFTGTISTLFIFFISLLGSFYMFRDGQRFVTWVVKTSPLADTNDKLILLRISRAIRSVATGTLLLSILQGVVAGVGFSIFGIERAVLWGSVAALGALLPGIGTTVIVIPAVMYLVYIGSIPNAIGLLVWGIAAIVVVDNIIGPYLMSRGNNLHPFVMLLSVLGGISVFGPIGFIIGPVVLSLFVVLLEIYMHNISKFSRRANNSSTV